MRISILISFISLFFACNSNQNKSEDEVSPPYDQLVWSEEFEGESLDMDKWSYSIGDGCPHLCGWGNNELQYYTDKPKNVRLEDGVLILEVHKDSIGNRGFSSGKIHSRGNGSWKYGRFEVRAKLPNTLGSWAAIWMLPEKHNYGGWPKSGEMDIMEHVGWDPDSTLSTIHTGAFNHMIGTHKGASLYVPDCDETFHVYSLHWEEEFLEFFVDDQSVFIFKNEHKTSEEWPYDHPFYFIFNVAFGGNLGGKMGVDDSELPVKMEIDYARVYQ